MIYAVEKVTIGLVKRVQLNLCSTLYSLAIQINNFRIILYSKNPLSSYLTQKKIKSRPQIHCARAKNFYDKDRRTGIPFHYIPVRAHFFLYII